VVSDWGAVHDTVGPGRSGLDVEMPGPPRFWGEQLVAAVRAGAVPEGRIDEKVSRILRLAGRTGALGDSRGATFSRAAADVSALVRKAAVESFVLLKNEAETLPLASPVRVAVLGPLADGSALQGGGSSNIGPAFGSSPVAAL